MNKKWK